MQLHTEIKNSIEAALKQHIKRTCYQANFWNHAFGQSYLTGDGQRNQLGGSLSGSLPIIIPQIVFVAARKGALEVASVDIIIRTFRFHYIHFNIIMLSYIAIAII